MIFILLYARRNFNQTTCEHVIMVMNISTELSKCSHRSSYVGSCVGSAGDVQIRTSKTSFEGLTDMFETFDLIFLGEDIDRWICIYIIFHY